MTTYSFTMTAGSSGGIIQGYDDGLAVGVYGSIDAEPIPGETLGFLVSGAGTGIAFHGDLVALLTGFTLFVDGVEYPFDPDDDWAYDSGGDFTQALWGDPAGPVFVNGNVYSVELSDGAEAGADYSFTMTAGALDTLTGYVPAFAIGSIDAQPIPGQTLSACAYDPDAFLGLGPAVIVFEGNQTALLTTQTVWIDSVEFPSGTGWVYDGGSDETRYLPDSDWVLVDTEVYFIEIKGAGAALVRVPQEIMRSSEGGTVYQAAIAAVADEPVNLVEAHLAALGALIRIINEIIWGVQGDNALLSGAVVETSEQVHVREELGLTTLMVRAIAELVWGVEPAVTIQRGIAMEASEQVEVKEPEYRLSRAVSVVVSEVAQALESLGIQAGLVRLRSEVVSLVEAVVTSRGLARAFSEVESILESTVKLVEAIEAEVVRVLNETVNVLGASNIVKTIELDLAQVVSEAARIMESLTTARGLSAMVNEVTRLIEAVSTARVLARVVNTIVSVVESSGVARSLARVLSEVASVVEVLSRAAGRVRSVNETGAVIESPVKATALVRLRQEAVNLLSGHDWVRGFIVVVNEVITTVESLARRVALAFDTLVCACINLYAALSGAPTTPYPAVDAAPEVGPAVSETDIETEPAVSATPSIMECEDCEED